MSPTQLIYTNMPQDNANTQNIHAQIQELRHANSIMLLRLSQLEVIVHNITNNTPALEADSEQDTDDEDAYDDTPALEADSEQDTDDEDAYDDMPALEGDSDQDADNELDTDNHHDFTNHGLFASHVNFVII